MRRPEHVSIVDSRVKYFVAQEWCEETIVAFPWQLSTVLYC